MIPIENGLCKFCVSNRGAQKDVDFIESIDPNFFSKEAKSIEATEEYNRRLKKLETKVAAIGDVKICYQHLYILSRMVEMKQEFETFQ